jgi:hypothetical protein
MGNPFGKGKRAKEYEKGIIKQAKAAKIVVENPREIAEDILGLELWEFELVSGAEAVCSEKGEIHLDFQGKEMRIFINESGKLEVYTD